MTLTAPARVSQERTAAGEPARNVPVVCVGFSAGGLHPLRASFRRIRTDTGMAFVIFPHISRTLPTQLPLMSKWTRMPAELAQNGSGGESGRSAALESARLAERDHAVSRFAGSVPETAGNCGDPLWLRR